MKYSLTLLMLALTCVFLAACGKPNPTRSEAFNKAAPEIREVWEKAIVADRGNDYVAAGNGYRGLLLQRAKLTEEQIEALSVASAAFNQRLNSAANNGDADAKKAIAQLMAEQGRR
jgi:uncharacterized protein with FMN-binding domain